MKPAVANLLRAGIIVAALAGATPLAVNALRMPAQAANVAAARALPPAAVDLPATGGKQTIILAGGCFWGVQGVFQHVKGVEKAVSGYAGGSRATANYALVSAGATGHAEAVQVTYDPSVISLGEILRIFFSVATDPTQLNMQHPDHGPQYRNDIFVSTPDQKRVVTAYIAQLQAAKPYPKPIVTKVSANTGFYPAEAYHQDYLTLNPTQPYIAMYDMPKIADLKRLFPARYRPKPVLVTRRG